MRDLSKLSFYRKLRLMELVSQRYPELEKEANGKYPEYDGEVPISWLLSESEIEALLKEL